MLRLAAIFACLVLAGCSPQLPTPTVVDLAGDLVDPSFPVRGAEPHHWSEGADGLVLFDRQELALPVISISCPAPGRILVKVPALQRRGLEAGKTGEQLQFVADKVQLSGVPRWVSIYGDAALPEVTLDPEPGDFRRIASSKSLAVRFDSNVLAWNGPSKALWARFNARCSSEAR